MGFGSCSDGVPLKWYKKIINSRCKYMWKRLQKGFQKQLKIYSSQQDLNNPVETSQKHASCPASQVKKNQAPLLNREPLSWFCVSDLLLLIRRELLRAVTLDDSKIPTPVLHNTSVVVWNLYCVRVIIVRLNKRSKPRSFVHISADIET